MKKSSSFWEDGGESSRGKISKATYDNPREGQAMAWGLNIGCKKKPGTTSEKICLQLVVPWRFQETQGTDALCKLEVGQGHLFLL